jgi:Family of unknown function (DUF6523)
MSLLSSALLLLLVATITSSTTGFSFHTAGVTNSVTTSSSHITLHAKGFGSPEEKKTKSEGQVKREQQSSKYDEIAASGGQEYSTFLFLFLVCLKVCFYCRHSQFSASLFRVTVLLFTDV